MIDMNNGPLRRVTVTLPATLADKVAQLRVDQRISVSSIVECALEGYFDRATQDEVVALLRKRGASLRRYFATKTAS
ncbi:MAG: hypothetical protein NVS1B14_06700 [Vulcanimicrobiaceae bacterium]